MVTIVNCPQCGQAVPWEENQLWKPFCSERCKLIDLGEWASEGHKIPGEPIIVPSEDDNSDYH